jgi:hypothetical protein
MTPYDGFLEPKKVPHAKKITKLYWGSRDGHEDRFGDNVMKCYERY